MITEGQYIDALATVRAYLKQIDSEMPEEKTKVDLRTYLWAPDIKIYYSLSSKARMLLTDFGIDTFKDLVSISREKLSRVQGIGTKTLNEIDEFMKLHGVEFGMLDK